MDRRNWPWKKKTSEKVIATTDSNATLVNLATTQAEEVNVKNVKYIQITEESYAHLTELEDQVKILSQKLTSALSESTTKDDLVKQHAKVAEDAVSGWEKAEAEAAALKSQLESVTLVKLTAEDRASHLDGALKECMRQIRNVKEESEQKLHDVVLAKTKQWENVKVELETKIVGLNQEILKASAENNALSRSLQERSNMIMKITEEKAQTDAQIEVLKSNLESCDREISSLNYELHVVSKELEIRNEEKNMSLRSAEVANKQHLEGVKKIAKLEAECQRLRGLVRKKLPGPAALAQMKLEVDNLGREYMEPRVRRSPSKSSMSLVNHSSELESVQQVYKENELLTAHLTAMEEETKLLKEALAKCNSELQTSRNSFAETAGKLHILEAQLQASQQEGLSKLNLEIPNEASVNQNASDPPSLTSMSDNGIDENTGVPDSWTTALISELSQFKKEKNGNKGMRAEKPNPLELMNDFLEMERLACLSPQSSDITSFADDCTAKMLEKEEHSSDDIASGAPEPSSSEESSSMGSGKGQITLEDIQARITSIFESNVRGFDIHKVLEDMRKVMQDIQDNLPRHSVRCGSEENVDNGASLDSDNNICIVANQNLNQKLAESISHILDFVKSLGKELKKDAKGDNVDFRLTGKIDKFLESVNSDLSCQFDLNNFVIELSHILDYASKSGFNILSGKCNAGEINSSVCVDKLTLLENNLGKPDQSEENSIESALATQSSLDANILQDGRLSSDFEAKGDLYNSSVEDFKFLKREKDYMMVNLARCNEDLGKKRLQLEEKENLLLELKAQLASSGKSNSLAETQLKCMAESYKSLETRSGELETELNLLRTRAEVLEIELQEEKCRHKDVLTKCEELETRCINLEVQIKDLEAICQENEVKCRNSEDQIKRMEDCSTSSPSTADLEKAKQEREIAAAAEKLAECQETILLLGKHLKALGSPADNRDSSYNKRSKVDVNFQDNEPSPNVLNLQGTDSQDLDHEEMERNSIYTPRFGGESPLNVYHAPKSPSNMIGSPMLRSPINLKHPKNSDNRLASSSGSMTPEKHGRGFSRFFSKGKGSH